MRGYHARVPIALLRLSFAAALVAVLVLSLWPMIEPPPLSTGWDKTNHVAAYLVLGLLGLPSWPDERTRVLLGLIAYGALIEVLQGLGGHRLAEWGDLAADAIGVGLAGLLFTAWSGRRRRIAGRE
jgi:VanZ family protein